MNNIFKIKTYKCVTIKKLTFFILFIFANIFSEVHLDTLQTLGIVKEGDEVYWGDESKKNDLQNAEELFALGAAYYS